jgi:hypothetical protein
LEQTMQLGFTWPIHPFKSQTIAPSDVFRLG